MPLVELRKDYINNLEERIKWFGEVMVRKGIDEMPFFVNTGRDVDFYIHMPSGVKDYTVITYGWFIMRRSGFTGRDGNILRIVMRGDTGVHRNDPDPEYPGSENDVVYLTYTKDGERFERYFLVRYGERGSIGGIRFSNLVPVRLRKAYNASTRVIDKDFEVVMSVPTFISLYIMYYPILRQF